MPLTAKLVLGFLFALALQVAQIVVSAHFTELAQDAGDLVVSGLATSLATQSGIEAVQQLRERARQDRAAPEHADFKVEGVYLQEVDEQAAALRTAMPTVDPPTQVQIAAGIRDLDEQLEGIERLAAGGAREELADALAFFDDSARELDQQLRHFQVHVREVATAAAQREREVHDLPLRASLAIAVIGVVVMAVFVAWFSRQLLVPIRKVWSELEQRVADRTRELAGTVEALEAEIVQRKTIQAQKDDLSKKLIEASRRAGMAEIANGVLHNVGNVLNNVNVSADLLVRHVRESRIDGVAKVAELLRSHADDLAEFMTATPQGGMLPDYLGQLAAHLRDEQDAMLEEAASLSSRIEHIKDIIGRQQSYARCAGVSSVTDLGQLIREIGSMYEGSLLAHRIELQTDVDADEPIEIDRSRVMQIVMNLVSNAKHAIQQSGRSHGTIRIAVRRTAEAASIAVHDDGVGIAPENLSRIFALGFTTKRNGHGFGLHHSANAATEMGGRLSVSSEGPDRGATFRLELPAVTPAEVGS